MRHVVIIRGYFKRFVTGVKIRIYLPNYSPMLLAIIAINFHLIGVSSFKYTFIVHFNFEVAFSLARIFTIGFRKVLTTLLSYYCFNFTCTFAIDF